MRCNYYAGNTPNLKCSVSAYIPSLREAFANPHFRRPAAEESSIVLDGIKNPAMLMWLRMVQRGGMAKLEAKLQRR